jgi:hypothetical protein
MPVAPSGVPEDMVNRVTNEVAKAAALLNDKIAKWSKVVTTAGMKAE